MIVVGTPVNMAAKRSNKTAMLTKADFPIYRETKKEKPAPVGNKGQLHPSPLA
jgi:hypothetical protein